ncbi:hypothetical protein AFGD_001885 [Aspergillus flavus]|nr:hypothetical protein AFGD_001885 [Aspergillus flavus]
MTRSPSALRPPEIEVYWNEHDREDLNHWPLWYKRLTIFNLSLGATVASLSSMLFTSVWELEAFCGLLCEVTDRRPVYIGATFIFVLLILPSALASNIEAILISRFFGGFFGSTLMANSPASIMDIVSEEHRALAFGFWSIGPTNAPVLLSRRAAQRRKDTQTEKWWTRYDGAKDLKLLLRTAYS